MKKKLMIFTLIIISYNATAQDRKGGNSFIKFGYGYFLDISNAFYDYKDPNSGLSPEKTVGGKALWVEGGYKLPNNIIVSANIMFASSKRQYIDIIYHGQNELIFNQDYAVNFNYEFNLSKHHKFTPGFGFLFNIRSTTSASYEIETNNGNIYFTNPHISETDDFEIGINLNLDYYYLFNNSLFVGARVNTVYLLNIGLENFIFSPVLGVKF